MFHIALYQPEIPPNTGNIGRQCVGMRACLHLIGPVAFDLSHSAVKRAGLDYWDDLDLRLHADPEAFLQWLGGRQPWVVTRQGLLRYDKLVYRDGDVIIFGSETKGLPSAWFQRWQKRSVYIPILGPVRNYNLANSVGIVLAQACLSAGLYDAETGA
jgi:tRNA (cytidine/uridine-2'-O-)-methyltransferase